MYNSINILRRNSTSGLTLSVDHDWEAITTRTISSPHPYLPALGLSHFSIIALDKPNIELSAFISEHTAFAVAALLDAERSRPEDFMAYDDKVPKEHNLNLLSYAKLIFQGASIAHENTSSAWQKDDIFRRYINAEEAFTAWRSAIQQEGTASQKHNDIPWNLIINNPDAELDPYKIEIQLDSHIIQSTLIRYLHPLAEILGICEEDLYKLPDKAIHVPLSQHRALLLIYVLEHLKCLEQSTSHYLWGEEYDYMVEGIVHNHAPYQAFRQALSIIDSALGQESYNYSFAPYRYDACDDLVDRLDHNQ